MSILYRGYNKDRYLINHFNDFNRVRDPFVEAEQMEKMKTKMGGYQQVADHLGMTYEAVYFRVHLLALSEEVRDMVEDGRLAMTSGELIGMATRNANHQLEIANEAIGTKLRSSVKDVRKAITNFKERRGRQ